jgi:hypothetical protein
VLARLRKRDDLRDDDFRHRVAHIALKLQRIVHLHEKLCASPQYAPGPRRTVKMASGPPWLGRLDGWRLWIPRWAMNRRRDLVPAGVADLIDVSWPYDRRRRKSRAS